MKNKKKLKLINYLFLIPGFLGLIFIIFFLNSLTFVSKVPFLALVILYFVYFATEIRNLKEEESDE